MALAGPWSVRDGPDRVRPQLRQLLQTAEQVIWLLQVVFVGQPQVFAHVALAHVPPVHVTCPVVHCPEQVTPPLHVPPEQVKAAVGQQEVPCVLQFAAQVPALHVEDLQVCGSQVCA
jgi:hypothetical protein